MNRIKKTFDTIHAEDGLKQKTINFLETKRQTRQKRVKYIYKCAAAFAILIVGTAGIHIYSSFHTAVSYISIDTNPSIELSLNRFDHVIKASAYNDDGSHILQELNLQGKPYIQAIDSLLENPEFISYLNENNRIDFTVVSNKQDEIMSNIQECKGYGQYDGYCHGIDSALALQAHEHGLSIGKYRAYIELAQYDDTVTAEDCQHMTMKQINDQIIEHSGHESSQQNLSSQNRQNAVSQNGHHGYGMGRHNGGWHHNQR